MRTANIKEWIGKNDDQAIPPRVKLRVFALHAGTCAICTNRVTAAAYDHTIALINGGENRESNLSLLCLRCHKTKSRADVAEKSKVARVKAKHLGITTKAKRPIGGRGFARAEPQRTASRPIHRTTEFSDTPNGHQK